MAQSGPFAKLRDLLDRPAHPVAQVAILVVLLTLSATIACVALTVALANGWDERSVQSQARTTLRDYCAAIHAYDWNKARSLVAPGVGDPEAAWTGREAGRGRPDSCDASEPTFARVGETRTATATLVVWYDNNTSERPTVELRRKGKGRWQIISEP